ncbi:MAG: YncE family protein [Kiloniellaceae bacterium]
MKSFSILGITASTGLLALLVGTSTAIAEPLVYVPLGGEGKIAVVDAAKDEFVSTIDGLVAVHGLAGTPDGKFLIAGSFQEREADESAPAKPSGVTEDEHAAHHGAAPADAQKADAVVSTVSVVRTADGSVVRRIDVPGAVHHAAVSPDGRFAVVTHPNEGTVSAIDLNSYQIAATVTTGPAPNYAAFSPDSSRLFVSNAGNGTVSEVDTERWIVRRNAVVGSSPEHVVLSRDGSTVFVNNVEDGTVSVLNTDDLTAAKTISVGSTLHGIDLSDDGGTLLVADLGDDKIVAFDLATDTYRSATLAPAPYHLAAIRGAGKLYVSSADEPKIWVIDQRSLKVLGEIPIGGKGHQMVQGAGG